MDKIECNSIAELFSRSRNSPLMVGSIKSNIGQAEAAAGYMSVLKALFVLDSGILTPNKPSPKLNNEIQAFNQNRLQVI